MAVLSKEDFMSRIQAIAGEDTSDETLSLIEDMTDTYNDLESKTGSPEDGEDWKSKYEELDATWRKKYSERFFSNEGGEGDPEPDPEPGNDSPKTYEDLFEEEKE